jgi:hypothetical protein
MRALLAALRGFIEGLFMPVLDENTHPSGISIRVESPILPLFTHR